MRRVQGSAEVRLLECVNPVKDKWHVRWDVRKTGDGSADYMEAEFDHKPGEEEIRATVVNWIDKRTGDDILSGLDYKGNTVWLSVENQLNYKAAHDLAVQTGGGTLPVTFKLGTDECPVYYEFHTLKELGDFYTSVVSHIQKTLETGWRDKDCFDMEKYQDDNS